MVFTPAPEWLKETARSAARWAAATCSEVRVGEQGLLVESRLNLVDYMGVSIAGGTLRDELDGECRGLVLDPVRAYAPFVIAHEMRHCLGARNHTASGIGYPGGANIIDAASLEDVCAVWECGCFAPETQALAR